MADELRVPLELDCGADIALVYSPITDLCLTREKTAVRCVFVECSAGHLDALIAALTTLREQRQAEGAGMSDPDVTIEASSGNVFADLGLPDADALLVQADLAIARYRRAALADAALELLREMVRFVDTLDARGPYELLPDIRALLATAEQQP